MPTDLLKEEFEPAVRARGEDYAAAGYVRCLSVKKSCLTSEVHGSEIYDVTIDLERMPEGWDLLA